MNNRVKIQKKAGPWECVRARAGGSFSGTLRKVAPVKPFTLLRTPYLACNMHWLYLKGKAIGFLKAYKTGLFLLLWNYASFVWRNTNRTHKFELPLDFIDLTKLKINPLIPFSLVQPYHAFVQPTFSVYRMHSFVVTYYRKMHMLFAYFLNLYNIILGSTRFLLSFY